MEDAIVIYRMARAPERRLFYIDVGNLPKAKAENYLRDVMARYRTKISYDQNTGEIRDDKKFMSMLEDYWLPRREGGRGTEVSTLPGGQNLGELEDLKYFQDKLYKSLNVPISRQDSGSGFQIGKSDNIMRDEVKFSKFVGRMRKKFSYLFTDILKTQLVLKGVVSPKEFDSMKEHIQYDFIYDNHFAELQRDGDDDQQVYRLLVWQNLISVSTSLSIRFVTVYLVTLMVRSRRSISRLPTSVTLVSFQILMSNGSRCKQGTTQGGAIQKQVTGRHHWWIPMPVMLDMSGDAPTPAPGGAAGAPGGGATAPCQNYK